MNPDHLEHQYKHVTLHARIVHFSQFKIIVKKRLGTAICFRKFIHQLVKVDRY